MTASKENIALNELEDCLSITMFLNLACCAMAGEMRHLPKNNRETVGLQHCFHYLQSKLEGAISSFERGDHD